MTDVEAIKARADAATPGPWRADGHRLDTAWLDGERGDKYGRGLTVDERGMRWMHDAEFIAHARTDIPWLLDRLAAVEAERDEARAELLAEVHRRLSEPGELNRTEALIIIEQMQAGL